jgi:MSHA biogenesis protein MshM
MLCRVLMERLPPHVATIYLATPSLAREEILHAIADDLDLKLSPERRSVALRELQEHLIALYGAGRRVVILIDEAHVMPEDTLEQVRLLSNLDSNRHKLLQIVLFGQPELDETLAKTALRQLRDRITHSFRMRPLALTEVAKYLSFRMRAAGYRGPEVFTPRAVRRIARASDGLTRRINILADKALLAAYTENTHAITDRQVRAAVADSEFAASRRSWRPLAYLAAAAAAGIAVGAGLEWMRSRPPVPPLVAPVAQAPQALAAPAPAPEPVREDPPEPAKPEPEPLLSAEQERRLSGYSPAGQRLLASRLSASRERLERVDDERYALELYVTENSDPARMERFLLRARELVPLEEVMVIPVAAGGQYRLWVLFGDFASREEAAGAARRLPPRYQDAFRIAPRSFGELRREL